MYIKPNTLIARRGNDPLGASAAEYGGLPAGPVIGRQALSGFWDTFSNGFSNFAKGFAGQPGQPGAMAPGGIVLTPGAPGYNPDLAAAYLAQQKQNQGIGLTDILLYGGVAAAVYFLVIKKKAA